MVPMAQCQLLKAFLIHDLGKFAWLNAQVEPDIDGMRFSAEHVIGPGDDDTVRAINESRNRRMNRWLVAPQTRTVLVALAIVLLRTFDVMTAAFKATTINNVGA